MASVRVVTIGLAVAVIVGRAPHARPRQHAPLVAVQLRVVDSADAPVAGADVALLRSVKDIIAAGTSDARGLWTVSLAKGTDEYQFVVRKVGYTRADQFFAPTRDTMRITIQMRRAVQTLAPVTISEREDLKRKSYHLDADDIANTDRVVIDATDILTKLRPDMLNGRGHMCAVRDIWVNGVRITNAPVNELARARIPGMPPRPVIYDRAEYGNASGQKRPLKATPLASLNRNVWYVLASIKPEHIEEVNYVDCFDTSMERLGQYDAMFIVLKPGIRYEPGVGSVVVQDSVVADAPDISLVARSYRDRILGVFDEETGEPLAGVRATDSTSGRSMATTTSGTMRLAFLPDGRSTVTFTKPGYVHLTQTIVIARLNVSRSRW